MKVRLAKNETVYAVFAKLLFAALFTYLLLRAYFVAPLHDEVATLFHYIETGVFWGDNALLDANNHVLNSFIGHKIYLLLGDNFFFLRLPNVLSFGLFFWSIVQLIGVIKNPIQRAAVLLALSGIPFFLEYFAYTRGYGMSLSFFLSALVFLGRYTKATSLGNLFIAYTFLVFAVYANLTYLVSCILAIGFVILLQLLALPNRNWRKQIVALSAHSLLLLAIWPAIRFAEKLKIGGALYYGTLDGFWEVTGKTLTEYTLFFIDDRFKWVLLLVGVLLVGALISLWLRQGTDQFFGQSETIIAWFLFGHIAAILCLAHFFQVNYPEDRVGMYLVPLFILVFAQVLNRWKTASLGIYILLIFPVLFLSKINLTSSVFSPEQRMTETFYAPIANELNSYSTLSVYPLMRLTWAMHNRNSEIKNTVSDYRNFNSAADYILAKKLQNQAQQNELTNYKLICEDLKTGYVGYKRKKPFHKTTVFGRSFTVNKSNDEFTNFATFIVPDSLRNKKLQVHIEGKMMTTAPFTNAHIVYSTFDKKGNSKCWEGWNLRWSIGGKNQFFLNYNYPIHRFETTDHEVKLYLWNLDKERISIKNGKFEIISLE